MARRKVPRIPDALLDQLLAGANPETAFDANGLLDDLKKALAERALNAEMDHHLAGDPRPFVGPPEVRVSGTAHGGGLGAPPEFCNVIGGLWPMAPCGRSSL